MSVQETIVAAIRKKLVISAHYQGYPRVMCPHVIGYKEGHVNALFFQFAGGSSRGLPPGGQWRCLRISELSNVSASPGEWHTSSSYGRMQECIDQIIAQV